MLTTALAFVLALGLLIAVHEYGHYRIAVACGVKVLRFSVGFGKPILTWRRKGSPTEFVIGALPLGGYVRMLDEREAPVDPQERHLAFNNQSLRKRAAIVAAGPAANLLLAVFLYAAVFWAGVDEPRPVLGTPVAGSPAERAGLQAGDRVLQIATEGQEGTPVVSFDDLRWRLTQAALDGLDVTLWVSAGDGDVGRPMHLRLSDLDVREADATLVKRIGLLGPYTAPVIGQVMSDGAGAAAGLQKGDRVRRIDGREVRDANALREAIRTAVGPAGAPVAQHWEISRAGQVLTLTVVPRPEPQGQGWVGRISAYVGEAPAMTTVRYGVLVGLWQAAVKTGEVSWLTLKMMGRMLIGEASIKNLSGPLTIADYAGKSATLGLSAYVMFLALISVSLGVLNLLPLPVLDGGHLMYYLWEFVTGRRVSDAWMERLQRGGFMVLMLLMSVALFNDVARLAG